MQVVRLFSAAAVLLLIGLFGNVSAQVPPTGTVGSGESRGSGVVSPVVVATWITHGETSDLQTLDILVLWRGTPGWFLRAGSASTTPTFKIGRYDLGVRFDPQTRTARIQGKEIVLRDANVILVDHVDGAEGPHVVGTVSVGAASLKLPFSESGTPLGHVLRRSAELVSFLRCDTPLPDPTMQARVGRTCAELMEK